MKMVLEKLSGVENKLVELSAEIAQLNQRDAAPSCFNRRAQV